MFSSVIAIICKSNLHLRLKYNLLWPVLAYSIELAYSLSILSLYLLYIPSSALLLFYMLELDVYNSYLFPQYHQLPRLTHPLVFFLYISKEPRKVLCWIQEDKH
jgi:hypothetical protein